MYLTIRFWEQIMQKIVGVTELQRRFRAIFDEVVRKQTPVILTRGSRPEAVLISYQDYLRFQEIQESEVLQLSQSQTVKDRDNLADRAAGS
jgi:prevent-host-death family protein